LSLIPGIVVSQCLQNVKQEPCCAALLQPGPMAISLNWELVRAFPPPGFFVECISLRCWIQLIMIPQSLKLPGVTLTVTDGLRFTTVMVKNLSGKLNLVHMT
jgi:hypothetical protein